MRKFFVFLLLFVVVVKGLSQPLTEHVIIVTLDGFRWQELFGGADSILINDASFTEDVAETKQKFWAGTPEERREKLLPFTWNIVAKQGQIYGNRQVGNFVDVKNPYRISFPGYNEIFTGFPDTMINSNDKKYNPNETVLEFLNKQTGIKDKVAAFASWDVFNFIFHEKRCGFPVNAGIDFIDIKSSRFALLNEMQQDAFRPFGDGIRPDLLTYYLAKEYMLAKKPKVLFIGFDDTDDWAHNGRYDYYLQAANLADAYLANLWNTLQSLPEYKDHTTLLLLTDHGRGDEVKKEWTSHGKKIKGASQIWMAFLGKGIEALGEIKQKQQVYQSQFAQTVAKLLGYQFTANHPVDNSLQLKQRDKD